VIHRISLTLSTAASPSKHGNVSKKKKKEKNSTIMLMCTDCCCGKDECHDPKVNREQASSELLVMIGSEIRRGVVSAGREFKQGESAEKSLMGFVNIVKRGRPNGSKRKVWLSFSEISWRTRLVWIANSATEDHGDQSEVVRAVLAGRKREDARSYPFPFNYCS
jgi:hypothetical protein